MNHKTISILLPTFIGILLAIIFLQIRETFFEHIYRDDDAILFQPLFDINLFYPVYIIAYIIALVFQFFVTLKVWRIYKIGGKILGLKLWQLIMLCCLLFGLAYGLICWNHLMSIQALLFKILEGIILPIIYWIGNLITLLIIDKRYSNQ